MKHVIVVTSTLPASKTDSVPEFVQEQVVALKKLYPEFVFTIVAPHDARSNTKPLVRHEHYFEYRFHYFWPRRLEKLAGHGIMPTLKKNPAYYLLIPFYIGAEFFALWRLTRRTKPDLLYAHWFMPQGITAGLVSMITKVPFVYTSHSSDVSILRRVPLLGSVTARFFTKRARAVTVVSRRSLKKLKNFFSESAWQNIKDAVRIIPMGVDTNVYRAGALVDRTPKNILFIGRLVEKKGIQFFLPAFKELTSKDPELKLVVAGDGAWRPKLVQQAQELGLTNVTFPGYVTLEQKQKWLAWADVFVVPSIITRSGDAEGLPVTLMEALAAGKICIATNESGADEILVEDGNGFLVPQRDTAALHDALSKALSLDAEERKRLRQAARQTAQRLSWTEIATSHKEFLFADV